MGKILAQARPTTVDPSGWQLFWYNLRLAICGVWQFKTQAEPCHICMKPQGLTCVLQTYDNAHCVARRESGASSRSAYGQHTRTYNGNTKYRYKIHVMLANNYRE